MECRNEKYGAGKAGYGFSAKRKPSSALRLQRSCDRFGYLVCLAHRVESLRQFELVRSNVSNLRTQRFDRMLEGKESGCCFIRQFFPLERLSPTFSIVARTKCNIQLELELDNTPNSCL